MTDAEDRQAVLDKLELLAQPDVEPTLSAEELDLILDNNQKATRWVTATALVYGQLVLPSVRNGHVYRVIVEGTTTTEPTWPLSFEGTVTAGAQFEEAGLDFGSAYDLRGAIRACWELKASKASDLIASEDGGSEQMIYEQCMKMVDKYLTPMVI